MQCKEFRSLMIEGGGNEGELEQHLGNCPACSTWLEREIAEPPSGLTPAQWQAATARCFPENLPATPAATPIAAAEPVTFWNSYLNGMTYGLVFGLSIVFGFAILQLLPDADEKPFERSLAQISFVEESARELPVFFAEKKFDVTFLANEDSEMMNFVEFDSEMKFLEDSEEENL